MISVQLRGQRFHLRAAAIILHEGSVLLHRAFGDAYWALPGGRVDIGEEASATIVREMKEELGEEVVCGRLVHVAENFFDLVGQRHHEIGLYFLASLDERSPCLDKARTYTGIEKGVSLEFRWFPQDGLASANLRPTFLQASLAVDPPAFVHAVQRDHV